MSRKLPKTLPPVASYAELQALDRQTWSEATFLKEVLALAKQGGWRRVHFRTAQTAKGRYLTSMDGEAGFPDLLMIRAYEMIVAELKVGTNKTTEGQNAWLLSFNTVAYQCDNIRVFVWRPADWTAIVEALK